MAEPKKRTNNTKQGMRRMHDKIARPTLVACANCHQKKSNHTVCPNCGNFEGKKIIEVK